MFHIRINKFWLKIIVAVIVLAAVIFLLWTPLGKLWAKTPFGQTSYYAVQLNNGQSYFGHIKSVNSDTIVLTDVFYFESYQSPASTSTAANLQVQAATQTIYNFTKRGVTSPMLTDGQMSINRSAVLFWEKLTPDSQLAQWIEQGTAQK